MSCVIIEERSAGVVRLLLNREDVHNALNQDVVEHFTSTLLELRSRKDLRVLQLGGKGKSFCAGADLNWMKDSVHLTKEENRDQALGLGALFETLVHFPCPTIALAQGAVFGGGVGLVAACDIAFTMEEARFCLSEVKLGLIPALISPLVIEAIGHRQAQKLMLTAEIFKGAQATQWGLTHGCASSLKGLEEEVDKTTQHLLKGGPEAQSQVKSLGRFWRENSTSKSLTPALAEKISECRATPEAQEGLAAFLEKRDPQWMKNQT